MKEKITNKKDTNKKDDKLEYGFLDIQLDKINQDYKKTSIYLEINNEYHEKYNLTHQELFKKRYNNDQELLNFYNQYFNEVEKLEKIGMCIWKLFGNLWNDEKQTLILQILSLTLLIEKQSLLLKRAIMTIKKNKLKSKKVEDMRFKADILHFLKLIKLNKDCYINDLEFIDIKSNYDELEKIYLKKRGEVKKELYKEYDRFYSDITSNYNK
jgi:hypothetical protein